MDKQLSDIVDGLWKRIMMAMQGDDGELCADYLRTAYQKCLFAQERLKSLTVHVDDYKQKLDCREILDSLLLAMDYDHLLISLCSALEHLARLISATVSQKLSGHLLLYQEDISLRKIISIFGDEAKLQDDPVISKLLSYLDEKVGHSWYKQLVEPQVVISHDRFRDYPRVLAHNISQQLLDFRFLLPDTVESDDTSEGSIIAFCRNLIEEVEEVLKQSFSLIKEYLRPLNT
jgi:hypothetical protein